LLAPPRVPPCDALCFLRFRLELIFEDDRHDDSHDDWI
jgi:hypothetical protein